MEKKKLITSVIVLLVALVLIAVLVMKSSSDEGSSDEPLIVYFWDDPVLVSIVEAYEKAHPEVVLDKQIIPASEYQSKMAILLAANADMDVWFGINANDTLTHNDNGFIEDLKPWFEKTGADMSSVEAYDKVAYQDGKIVGVPWRGGAHYLYYNKKIFNEKNVPTPDTYVEKGEWTWEKFAEVSSQLASGDGEIYGGLVHTWTGQQFLPSIQAGKNVVTRDGKIDIGPETFTFLKLRKKMEAEKAMPSLIDMKASRLHYSQAFFRGNLGMLIIGEWFPGMLKKGYEDGKFNGFEWEDWGLTRIPCDQTDYRTWAVPTMVNMASRSKNKETAFQFVSWMGTKEGQEVVATAGAMPAISTPAIEEIFKKNIPDEKSLDYFFEEKINMPGYINKYKVDDALLLLTEEFLSGSIEEDELESRAIVHLKRIIKEAN